MLRVFVLGCFLTMGVVKSSVKSNILDDSDQIEDVIPLLFPNMFSVYNRNCSGSKLRLNHKSNGGLAKNSDGFVQGYSLKPNMKESDHEARAKRGVIQIYNMLSCATECRPGIYKGYGCYCGFLGFGQPVDGIDECCMNHDQCYTNAQCPLYFLEYVTPYYWKCRGKTPICAGHHGMFGGANSCAGKLCECDRVLSECLKRYSCPSKPAFCKSSYIRLLRNTFKYFTKI